MNRYSVKFTKSAGREFNKLPGAIQDKIIDAIEVLSINPFSELLRVKKLKGAASLYRIRAGEYRIVYEVRKDILIILIIKIGHRRDVYRNV